MSKRSLYWACQVGGWLAYVLVNFFYSSFALNNRIDTGVLLSYAMVFVFGVIYSHIYRTIIVRQDWLRMKKWVQIPSVIISILLLGAALHFTQFGAEYLFNLNRMEASHINYAAMTANIVNFAFLFFFWSLIYFLVHYFENYRKAEIENLKWEASIREIELNKLKSQLNPHFIFNSMNSIRALVDEDPEKAKASITQLSNILRNTLLMGRQKVVSFDEEFRIVKDYLDLEATRFEERLKVAYNIHPESSKFEVPPLMIQTLVENGIKHGISRLTAGGELSLQTALTPDGKLEIVIRNHGQLNGMTPETGFGIKNTRQRLELLYGGEASFSIENENADKVKTKVVVPRMKLI